MALIYQDPATGEWKVQAPHITSLGQASQFGSATQPPIMPPASLSQPQSVAGVPQLNQQIQIPMPGQLGDAAQQSPLFSDNWASLFNQG